MPLISSESLLSRWARSVPDVAKSFTVFDDDEGKRCAILHRLAHRVPGVMLISISLPSRLGDPCWACESERMRSFAGRPSIVESIVICASTRGAPGYRRRLQQHNRSTLPTRTPASRTSDPSRKPFASTKRAFKRNFSLNGLMSPEALSTRKISTTIANSTNMPTRTWLRLILVLIEAWRY
jgi:hypothetical protein